MNTDPYQGHRRRKAAKRLRDSVTGSPLRASINAAAATTVVTTPTARAAPLPFPLCVLTPDGSTAPYLMPPTGYRWQYVRQIEDWLLWELTLNTPIVVM